MLISNPTIPFCSPVGGYISPGTIIRIGGNVSPYSQCFAINLQCGGSVNPRDDVALHLSPVFSPPPRIVRNSIQNNSWGPEESFGGFPLSPGQSFEFMILIEPSQFKIALNGVHFTEFRHRIPFERITHIAIDGDVRIDVVSVDSQSGVSIPPSMSGQPYPSGMGGMPPYPMGGSGSKAPYPSMGFESTGAPYPPEAPPAYSSSIYPSVPPTSGPYPSTSGPYPPSSGTQYPGAPGAPYPGAPGAPYPGAPGGQYPPQKSGGIGGKVSAALGGLTAGVAATSIGSALFGGSNKHGQHGSHMPGMPGMGGAPYGAPMPGQHKPHKKSSSIPIGTIAAGAGAAALGAAVLSHVNPLKKAKKMFKHKHKGGWHHKGWSSSSSSSSSSEEE